MSVKFKTNIEGNVTGNADTATKIASIANENIVQLTGAQTLTSKTLYRPTIEIYAAFEGGDSGTTKLAATAVAGNTTLTLPAATDTLVGKDTADTLTNKNVRLTVETPTTFPYTLAAADAGKIIDLTASGSSIEVPIDIFFPGDRITIINSYVGGSQTISAASGCTLYYNGTAYVGASFNLPARKMLIFHCTVGGANPVFFSQS
jgi:hypothetical protein